MTPIERLERKYERLEAEGKLTPRRQDMLDRRLAQLERKPGFKPVPRRKKPEDLLPRSVRLDQYNAQLFKDCMASRITRHVTQMHPTRGYRHRNKLALAIARMTPAERWNKVIVPMIAKARKKALSAR